MSSYNQSSLDNVPEFAKQIIMAFINGTRVSFIFLMLGTVYASLLVPLLFSLFAFSTPAARRQPIFILVVLTVLLGIALGVWNGYLEGSVLTAPFDMGDMARKVWAFGVAFCLTPWLVEAVLLLRLIAVYPPRTMSLITSIGIFAFPILIKIARMVGFILFFVSTWNDLDGNGLNTVMSTGFVLPYTKMEFIMQIFDNGYVSALFLLKLRGSVGHNGLVLGRAAGSIAYRIRMLFWIAASNFVFPVAFNIAQVVVLFTTKDTPVPSYLMWTNNYISIIGLVFATVWSQSTAPTARRVPVTHAVSTAFRSSAAPGGATGAPFSFGGDTSGPGWFGLGQDSTGSDTLDIALPGAEMGEKKPGAASFEKAPPSPPLPSLPVDAPLTVRIDETRTTAHV